MGRESGPKNEMKLISKMINDIYLPFSISPQILHISSFVVFNSFFLAMTFARYVNKIPPFGSESEICALYFVICVGDLITVLIRRCSLTPYRTSESRLQPRPRHK